MYSSGSSTPDLGYYKLPPIITTEADREFLNEVNTFVDNELRKINHLDEEERYLVYKTVFNKVIEHVTAYKPVLVQIKKEYEDTIDIIKKGQREATFLQEKLKAMASEPSTLRNYRKRADELEERIAILKKKNEQFSQELHQIKLVKEEKEKRPKTAEKPERVLKKDRRLIPGLSIEDSTDMTILHKKYETLDRQIKELNLSLRARFLPKTHKLQLKETLDNKVAYRDQLLWQSQVYKARGQKLKIALEAAQAYNQMKPPHQTVGDAVTIAFQQASGMLKAEREKTEGEQADTGQTATFEDDDPNKEKEAEMMLEYIEKFNELFEDGLFEEAAVHAANSPKGILRTQATLAKFRDVKVKTKGRSPLLAFCDSIMSSVKAAGTKPNEALSLDCMEACLNENRLDLAYHWLSQDRLTQSVGLGKMISEHCSCPLPCKCGCQALAQSVFTKLKCHQDVVLTMLRQGKVQGALQYGQLRQCISDENVKEILAEVCDECLVNGLMEGDVNGTNLLTELNLGTLLQTLVELEKIDLASNLIQTMQKHSPTNGDATTALLSLDTAVITDTKTTPDQWMMTMEALNEAGYQDSMLRLLAMTFVVDIIQKAFRFDNEDEKGVSFAEDVSQTRERLCNQRFQGDDEKEEELRGGENLVETGRDSSLGLSSRSRETTSLDHSSRETSPDVLKRKLGTKDLSFKKKLPDRQQPYQSMSSSEGTPRKSPVKKRVVKIARNKVAFGRDDDDDDDEDTDDDDQKEEREKRKVRITVSPNSSIKKPTKCQPRVKFDNAPTEVNNDREDETGKDIQRDTPKDPKDLKEIGDNKVENSLINGRQEVKFELESKKTPEFNKINDKDETVHPSETDDIVMKKQDKAGVKFAETIVDDRDEDVNGDDNNIIDQNSDVEINQTAIIKTEEEANKSEKIKKDVEIENRE